uniref:Putative ribulose-1,5 bisphosphate carboxylase/oxygenase large subunit N-methyltransferase, chloroplastic n=1 Tax=Anthurium amnicola TaxID=1678845 RepID=A0A1D1YF49_9ARAE
MEGCDILHLCLQPITDDDPLFSRKMKLISSRNLGSALRIPLSSTTDEALRGLERLVQAARILLLDEVELYFVEDDDPGPFSPRNELESLNSLLLLLLKWGEEQGVKTKLKICHFKGAGRGAVALQNIDVGATALEIPQSFIVCEELVYKSAMFDILKNLDGITAETMMLLWSMKERHDSNSQFKVYFDTLPKEFKTGLSFGIDALAALEGTVLLEEILQAKEHLHNQYDALCPALCTNYPKVFQPELYTWDQFLWACELWYSNSMKVVFSDGKMRTCLVPIAGLLNHSFCPHILRYGKVDSATNSLKLNLSRPCREGEQCYLSYGSLPSSHLVTFYGFLPQEMHENPYDVIPLDFEASPDDEGSETPNGKSSWTTHMVRGTWMAKSKEHPTFGLPPPLLDHIRYLLLADGSEQTPEVLKQVDVNKETERAVLETVLSIFNPMFEGIGVPDDLDRDGASWDVKLALDFKDLHRKIISSLLASCSVGLQILGSL